MFIRGDMTYMCDLELANNDTTSHLIQLIAMHYADNATLIHLLHVLHTSKFFCVWLNAVLVDSAFFSGVVTAFDPHKKSVYIG